METLCTIICKGNDLYEDYVYTCVPLKEAIENAEEALCTEKYKFVRVYAETNNGATLILIYSPTP